MFCRMYSNLLSLPLLFHIDIYHIPMRFLAEQKMGFRMELPSVSVNNSQVEMNLQENIVALALVLDVNTNPWIIRNQSEVDTPAFAVDQTLLFRYAVQYSTPVICVVEGGTFESWSLIGTWKILSHFVNNLFQDLFIVF